MRRGRESFKAAEKLLARAAWCLAKLPMRTRLLLLEAVKHIPTNLGIGLRYAVLKSLARSCGEVVALFDGVHFKRPQNAILGNNISIHPMCYIDATGGLQIGDDVSIAHGVTIMTTEHEYRDGSTPIREAAGYSAEVVIGNDVWIGAGVKILAGVTIGNHVVVGAGAVVTRSIPSNSLAVGVPARVMKEIRTRDEA